MASVYIWKCGDCAHVTEVSRPMAEYEIPPDAGCEACGCKEVARIITRPANVKGFVLEGQGWHDDVYSKTRSKF